MWTRGRDRVLGMRRIVERRAEQRHHHVADEFVDRAWLRKTISTIREKYSFNCATSSSGFPSRSPR